MPIPWAWTRKTLAELWGITPWMVDEAPAMEIDLALELMNIERQARQRGEQMRNLRGG